MSLRQTVLRIWRNVCACVSVLCAFNNKLPWTHRGPFSSARTDLHNCPDGRTAHRGALEAVTIEQHLLSVIVQTYGWSIICSWPLDWQDALVAQYDPARLGVQKARRSLLLRTLESFVRARALAHCLSGGCPSLSRVDQIAQRQFERMAAGAGWRGTLVSLFTIAPFRPRSLCFMLCIQHNTATDV